MNSTAANPTAPGLWAPAPPQVPPVPKAAFTPAAGRETPPPSEMELVLARIRCLARIRAAWLQHLWSTEGEPGGKLAVTHAEMATYLLDGDAPNREAAWQAAHSEVAGWRAELGLCERTAEQLADSRFAALARIFGLDAVELDLLQLCAAVSLDPALARVCAYLQDQAARPYVTEALAARLFGRGRDGVPGAESPLYRWELILTRETGPGEPAALVCDPHIRNWLLGREELDETLRGLARLHPPRAPLPGWPVAATSAFLRAALAGESGARARICVIGAPGAGRRTFAAGVAAELGLRVLAVEADAIDEAHWPRVFLRAQRQAFLSRCALAWGGETIPRRLWPRSLTPFPVQFVITESGSEPPPVPGLVERHVILPAPNAAAREALWREHLPAVEQWPAASFRALVDRFRLLPGDIADAARGDAGDPAQATRRARDSARSRLGRLAQRLECPFGWDDLVVAESLKEVLRDFEFEARHRLALWEQPAARGLFPQGRGLLGLFSGPPGTGKTMAAQVIAAALGYDLYRVNLAAVVSKWVGETSQNLERILVRAADMDVILLFDEADALFAKRATEMRDAQDRYANTDSAHLLQAVENYDGIALLTTNQKGNLDPAFLRRIRFLVDFPRPDAAQQERLWRQCLARLEGEAAAHALAGVFPALCHGETTGAQIKNATLGAHFIARREGYAPAARHLLTALERELLKEGRTFSLRERERILQHVG